MIASQFEKWVVGKQNQWQLYVCVLVLLTRKAAVLFDHETHDVDSFHMLPSHTSAFSSSKETNSQQKMSRCHKNRQDRESPCHRKKEGYRVEFMISPGLDNRIAILKWGCWKNKNSFHTQKVLLGIQNVDDKNRALSVFWDSNSWIQVFTINQCWAVLQQSFSQLIL